MNIKSDEEIKSTIIVGNESNILDIQIVLGIRYGAVKNMANTKLWQAIQVRDTMYWNFVTRILQSRMK